MILFVKGTRAYAIFTAIDCWVAGRLGMRHGGRFSVSAQCYRSSCVLCRWLSRALDVAQKDHCRIAAQVEGLTDAIDLSRGR